MTTKKILILILAIFMLLPLVLCACQPNEGPNKTNTSEETKTQEEQNKNEIYDAEIKDLGGHEFHIYAHKGTTVNLSYVELVSDGLNGDKVNDAVFERNNKLKEKYNATIKVTFSESCSAELRDPFQAQEYVCDFVFSRATHQRTLSSLNTLVDLRTVQNLNLEKAWWDQGTNAGLTFGKEVYGVTGDVLTIDDRSTVVMYFNADLVALYENTNLYDAVEQGKWTIDLMYKIMQACEKDVNGDGVIKRGDVYGYAADPNALIYHLVASGITLSERTEDGRLTVPLQPTQKLLDGLAALKPIYTSNLRYITSSGTGFFEAECPFYTSHLGSIQNFTQSELNLGIVPYPKLNEEQEKYHAATMYDQFGCCMIPNTVNNTTDKDWETSGFTSAVERNAYFLEALGYYSMKYLTPAYYDQVLEKQTSKDPRTVEMLDLILDNRLYDPIMGFDTGGMGGSLFKYLCGEGTGTFGNDMFYETFVSGYGSKVDAANKWLKDFYATVDGEAAA